MAKQREVGLIVLTDIPNQGSVAILQVRGTFNPEKMAPESWPGGCQLTAIGRVNKQESIFEALKRIIRKQLGAQIAEKLAAVKLERIIYYNDGQKQIDVFAVYISNPDFLKDIQLCPVSGGLRYVNRKGAFSEVLDLETVFDKVTGVREREVIAMFANEKRALQAVFKFFKQKLH